MNSKSQYYLQILDIIGAPLVRGVMERSVQKGVLDDKAMAQEVASLLAKSVQLSIRMGEGFDFAQSEDQGDSLRVALAGLAAQLLGDAYQKQGQALSEAEAGKIVAVLNSVLAFSDNFTPSEEAAERLASLRSQGILVDKGQADLQYIHAFLPLVGVITEFSFGQQESKLALEISDRLVKRAAEIRETRLSSLDDVEAQKRAEVSILDDLAQLFASCYRSVIKDMADQPDSAAATGIEKVWELFDKQSAVLDLMVASVLSDEAPVEKKSSGEVAPVAVQEDSVEEVPEEAPSIETIDPDAVLDTRDQKPHIFGVKAPDVPEEAAEVEPEFVSEDPAPAEPEVAKPAVSAGGGNPMSMFAKPKTENKPEEALVSEPSEEASASPVEEEKEEDNKGDSQGGGQANPMSFFKTGG